MSEKQEELSMEEAQKIWDEEANKKSDSAEDELEVSPDEEQEVIEEPVAETEEEEPQEEKASEETEEEQPPADPFEGLPDAVKQQLAKIDELEKSNQTLLHHIKTAEGRVAAMQREQDIARRVKEEVEKQNNETPTQKQITKAGKDPEKWTQLKEDYPDWAQGIEEFLSSKISSTPQQQSQQFTPQQIQSFVDQKIAASANEMNRKIAEATVDGRHPSWRNDVKSQDFTSWITNQPNEVRNLADSVAPQDAIRLMDLFYESKKTPANEIKQSRVQKLAKAATPNRRGQTPPPKSVDEMTAEELWNYEARKREKTREARGY